MASSTSSRRAATGSSSRLPASHPRGKVTGMKIPSEARSTFTASGKTVAYYALPALERAGLGKISRLPVSIRIVLESLLRNCDGQRVREADVEALAAWGATSPRTEEVPFVVGRVLLQDFTGVPL